MLHGRLMLVLLCALSLASVAQAKNGEGADKSREHGGQSERHKPSKSKKHREARFRQDEHAIVRDFYTHNPSRLPPGLAKRGGQLPPGLAKRGANLPPGLAKGEVVAPDIEVHLLPLPRELELRLPPPPHEVIRRIVGRDLILLDKHTRKVLDVLHDALP